MREGIEVEIVVHPEQGMQLSEGCITEDGSTAFMGRLPGLAPRRGRTREEVRAVLERDAREFYGDDVIVEIVSARTAAC